MPRKFTEEETQAVEHEVDVSGSRTTYKLSELTGTMSKIVTDLQERALEWDSIEDAKQDYVDGWITIEEFEARVWRILTR